MIDVSKPIRANIGKCERCGQDHDNVLFIPMEPLEDGEERWNYIGFCPIKSMQPIFVYVQPMGEKRTRPQVVIVCLNVVTESDQVGRQEGLVIQQLVDALAQYHSVEDCKAEGRTINCTACQALRMVKDL
jgi:hypothetical protein